MTRILSVAAVALLLVCAGASTQSTVTAAAAQKKPSAQPQGLASSAEIMEAFTIPLSDAIFAAGATPPADDEQWKALRLQALALAESANLLLIEPRRVDSGSWVQWAVDQREAAVAAMSAAAKKDAEALSTAADALYETCAGCHKVYLPSN